MLGIVFADTGATTVCAKSRTVCIRSVYSCVNSMSFNLLFRSDGGEDLARGDFVAGLGRQGDHAVDGAVSVCSIFIASTTTTGSPAATAPPSVAGSDDRARYRADEVTGVRAGGLVEDRSGQGEPPGARHPGDPPGAVHLGGRPRLTHTVDNQARNPCANS